MAHEDTHPTHHEEDPFRPGEAVDWTGLAERQRARLDLADAWWAMLERPAGKRLADVGCGAGVLSLRYAELGADVAAIEVRRDALEQVPAHPRLRTLLHDLQQAPLPERVDAMIVSDVLHHARQPARMLQHARQSTARLLVAETVSPPLEHRLMPEEASRLLREAGFITTEPSWPRADHYAILATSA